MCYNDIAYTSSYVNTINENLNSVLNSYINNSVLNSYINNSVLNSYNDIALY